MVRKLGPLTVALMLTAVFAVGCGDDNKSDSGGGGTATEQTDTGGTATDSTSTDSTSTDGGGDVSDDAVAQAIEQCKQAVDANSAVTADLKDDIKGICDNIKNPDDVKQLAKEVCLKIIEKTLPPGSARDTANKSCDSAGG